MNGRMVDKLYNGYQESGYHTVSWNASDHASGIYFIRLEMQDKLRTQKIILVK